MKRILAGTDRSPAGWQAPGKAAELARATLLLGSVADRRVNNLMRHDS